MAYEMNAKRIALISSSRSTVHTLLEEATALGIRVQHILELENIDRKGGESDSELPLKVEKFLRNLPGKRPVVAVIVEAVEAVAIAEYLKHVQLSIEPIWLIGSLGLDLHKLSAWRTVFHGGLFVEPHMPELAEFKNFFIEALQVCLPYFTNYRLTFFIASDLSIFYLLALNTFLYLLNCFGIIIISKSYDLPFSLKVTTIFFCKIAN